MARVPAARGVIALDDLPGLNAALNAATAALLTTGYLLIRRRHIALHRACMLSAFALSILFLASYLYYHAHAGIRPYAGTGWLRSVYFAILVTHTLLAAAVPPLAVVTITFGLAGRHPAHRKVARWTLPIWLYVSATGVAVYLLLYRLSS